MSDFGLFESDEAAQHQPRLAARTAAVKLEAAVDQVRAQFGRFLLGATGIDEFEDRWHLSKHDIRAAVEPVVFPNTGTMRRIKNALKADWKLAHPYKLGLSHEEAGFGSMPTGDSHRNQDLDKTYHPSDGNLIPKGDFEGWKDSVDQDGPEKVQRDFTPGGDSGSAKHAAKTDGVNEYPRELDDDEWYDEDDEDWKTDKQARRLQAGPKEDEWYDEGFYDDNEAYQIEKGKSEADENKKEAARLVADIYTDFARANGLRVASLDTLDAYASTGIHEADYRLLQSMIVRAAEECEDSEKDDDSDDEDEDADSEAPEASESDESDSDDDSDEDFDFGGEEAAEDDSDDEPSGDDDEEYDFGGGDDTGDDDFGDTNGDGDHDDADHHGGEQFTVPEQAPELDPQLMGEIPQGDTDGSAPVPPEVIDSLLGLPEGTIEQLLLEEVEQGGGYADEGPSAPGFGGEAGGDDFLGEAGGDNTQPPRMARRRRVAKDYGRKCPECKSNNTDYSSSTNDYDCYDCGVTFKPYSNSKKNPEKKSRLQQARKFWAAPDESEADLMARQKSQQRDSFDTKFGPTPQPRPDIQDLYHRAKNGDLEAYAHLKNLWNQRGWTAARRFWAAEGDEQQESEGGGEQQAPPQDPAAMGGVDPSMMGGQMMPPPGSQAVQPPQPPAPVENQPAEDALLDTANQAIMQMIDRETAEYQQIIGPLSQALQAVQFAQQVEQAEHPMDVTPPQGTVNVDPSQAPGGAGNPQQQLASLMRQAQAQQREAKTVSTLKNAAKLIAKTYGVNSGMLIEAMGRRNYEHVAEAFRILPPQALQTPEVRAAASHIGKMFAAENSMFNHDVWMDSVLGPRVAATGKERYRDKAYSGPRDKRRDEHGDDDLQRGLDEWGDEMGDLFGGGGSSGFPNRKSSRGRLPFDLARAAGVREAGETWKSTSTMDHFEFPNEQPEITDNMAINDLPQHQFKGLPKPRKNSSRRTADDLGTKVQRWLKRQQDQGLNTGGDPMAEKYLQTHKVGPRGQKIVHDVVGAPEHPYVQEPPNPRANPAEAINPVTKRGTLGSRVAKFIDDQYGGYHTRDDDDPEHVFTKQASFFTRKVPGWRWDDHLNGYISKEGRAFTCSCGQKVAAPSYKSCDCGKIWNVYAIGDSHHLASDTADMFIAREIPVRDNVIMANRRMAGAHPDEHYSEVSGYTHPGARRMQQILQDHRGNRPVDAITAIDADADWHLDHGNPGAAWVLQKEKEHGKPLSEFTAEDWAIAGHPPRRMANRKLASSHPTDHAFQGPALAPEMDFCMGVNGAGDCGLPASLHESFEYANPDVVRNKNISEIAEHERRKRQADISHRDLLAMIDKLAGHEDDERLDRLYDDVSEYVRLGFDHDDPYYHDIALRMIRENYLPPHNWMDETGNFLQPAPVRDMVNDWRPHDLDHPDFEGHDWEKQAARSQRELLAMIDKLADWTKYDDDVDPAVEAYGKNKVPSTSVSKPPKDWAKRKPAGDPGKKGGTWTPPTIPRKKK